MTHPRSYNPETDHQSATGCLNDCSLAGKASYALGLTTTSSSLGPLNPGIYLVFLDGLDPIRTVVLAYDQLTLGGSGSPAATFTITGVGRA
jgi:hypothetical protein